ncbi:hypothetical protein FHS35_007605 [Streptomyces umbrinus]|uniref:hypothetical protein n=1 Tax=Streptomyces umbrinus TaxID=67370 RepID=UPI00167D953B|nr:hypothetical protein [Streptomyces umbrinus]MCR3730712.1 hypothetical protein [Streptomyces umbrinus]GHH38231.1 hypothetical protein GCM10018775_16460 [Streptomyces umbrinus]
MSETLTLDNLSVPLRALRLLAVDFGHLPAPDVDVSTYFPDRLRLRFHDDLSAFEAWRSALGVDPATVVYREQNDGQTRVLKTTADFAGAVLELTGYGDLPVAAMAEAGAA